MIKKYFIKIAILLLLVSTSTIFAQTKTWQAQLNQNVAMILAKYSDLKGAQVAVMQNGNLLYAAPYGIAIENANPKVIVQNNSLFRVASVSKTLTAVATLKLIQDGKLSLDDEPFCQTAAPTSCTCSNGTGVIAAHLSLPAGKSINPVLCHITVRELLTMSAGWCETSQEAIPDNSPCHGKPIEDRMSTPNSYNALVVYGIDIHIPGTPATPEQLEGYFLTLPGNAGIEYPPGTSYNYSDFSYLTLGVLVNYITQANYGLSFEQYIQNFLASAAGVTNMRVGQTLFSQRYPDEVEYFPYANEPLVANVIPPEANNVNQNFVSAPYGGYYVPTHEANGGWIASATDLVKFINAIGSPTQAGILSVPIINEMLARPNFAIWNGTPSYFGMGWLVFDNQGNLTWTKNGSLEGTSAQVIRSSDNIIIAMIFNSRPKPSENDGFIKMMNNAINQAIQGVREQGANLNAAHDH